ncbi:hypothetical protein OJ996_18035 [Luteolibacter sp. GHJ8]|uniref:VapB protein of antitoxin of type II toxin-antitoxin system n=1 Tax=Luteolibacter rhizosphaerae TaxID=2989719 RepID=A0ABT3G6L6_9BACT|nr:hypothetical protein [Luteolibacter rhizosphaerae]MCW1915491.1 hypothetical protein [Luteolibacter rhizosphaerae]
MRLTIDVAEEDLKELMDLTGEKKKGPAVLKAALEFVRREKVREFTRRVMAGEFDYPVTNDELEAAEIADMNRHGAD